MSELLFDTVLDGHPLFTMLCYLITSIGGKHVLADIPQEISSIFKHNVIKIFVVMCMFYMYFRHVTTAIFAGLVFWIAIMHIIVPYIEKRKGSIKIPDIDTVVINTGMVPNFIAKLLVLPDPS